MIKLSEDEIKKIILDKSGLNYNSVQPFKFSYIRDNDTGIRAYNDAAPIAGINPTISQDSSFLTEFLDFNSEGSYSITLDIPNNQELEITWTAPLGGAAQSLSTITNTEVVWTASNLTDFLQDNMAGLSSSGIPVDITVIDNGSNNFTINFLAYPGNYSFSVGGTSFGAAGLTVALDTTDQFDHKAYYFGDLTVSSQFHSTNSNVWLCDYMRYKNDFPSNILTPHLITPVDFQIPPSRVDLGSSASIEEVRVMDTLENALFTNIGLGYQWNTSGKGVNTDLKALYFVGYQITHQ